MDFSYWLRQTPTKPLFPDIEWSKPEQKSRAGKLIVIGGHAQGFIAVAESYSVALDMGVGEVRVLMPDSLKKNLPTNLAEASLLKSNPSGGFSKDAWPDFVAATNWADGVLLPGDAGRNSETAILYEKLLDKTNIPITITRDAADLIKNNYPKVVERPNTLLVLSFAQIQKLFSGVYYPKVLTFSMPLNAFVDTLHKFTITYPVTLMVLHNENLVVASRGKVSTTPWTNAMEIWRGHTATRAASYWIWNSSEVFESVTTSLVSKP